MRLMKFQGMVIVQYYLSRDRHWLERSVCTLDKYSVLFRSMRVYMYHDRHAHKVRPQIFVIYTGWDRSQALATYATVLSADQTLFVRVR